MTGNDLFDYERRLMVVEDFEPDSSRDVKFVYAVARNLDKVRSMIKAVRSGFKKAPNELSQYQSERFDLAVECGGQINRDDNGNTYVYGVTDKELFAEKLRVLNKKYADAIQESRTAEQFNQQVLEEDIDEDIEWHKVDEKCVPSTLTAKQISSISFIIQWENDLD